MGKPEVGLTVIPLVTFAFLTNVLSTVEFLSEVQAEPGSSPILPKISIYAEPFRKTIASSPL